MIMILREANGTRKFMLIDILPSAVYPGETEEGEATVKKPSKRGSLPHRNECCSRPDVRFRSLFALVCIRSSDIVAAHSTAPV